MSPKERLHRKIRAEQRLTNELARFIRDYLNAWGEARDQGTMIPRRGWQLRLADLLVRHYGHVIVSMDGAGDASLPLNMITDASRAHRLTSEANLQSIRIMDRLERELAAAETLARTNRVKSLDLVLKTKKPKFSVVVISAMRRTWERMKPSLGAMANINTQSVAEEAAQAPLVDIVGNDAGAETWYKQWLSMEDHKVRPAHVAAHGQIQKIDDPYTVKGQLLRFPGDTSMGATLDNVINCFPADTSVIGKATNATRHWYDGELVEVTFASGNKLAGTPNHPVLTPEGWVALGSLVKGGNVIGSRRADHACSLSRGSLATEAGTLHIKHVETEIAQVFDAFSCSGVSVRVMAGNVDFHGDQPTQDVDIVAPHGSLLVNRQPTFSEHSRKTILAGTLLNLGRGFPYSLLGEFILRSSRAAASIVRGAGKALSFILRCHPHSGYHAVAAVARCDLAVLQAKDYGRPLDTERCGQGFNRFSRNEAGYNIVTNAVTTLSISLLRIGSLFSRQVETALSEPIPTLGRTDADALARFGRDTGLKIDRDEVVKVERRSWSGHVYNLETVHGLYHANGVVVHNCRCISRYGVMRDGEFVPVGNLETHRGIARPVRRPGDKPGSAAPRNPTRAFTFVTGNSRRRIILQTGENANVTVRNGAITIRVDGKPVASAPLSRDRLSGKFRLGPVTVAPSHQGVNFQRLLDASVEATNGLRPAQ